MSDERDDRSDQRGGAPSGWPGGTPRDAGPGDAMAADVSPASARTADPGGEVPRDRAGLAHWISPFERQPLVDPSRRATHQPRMRLEAELDSLRRRAEQLEGHLRQATAVRDQALAAGEEQRITAIELRTMLDATEYRIGTLEVEVSTREHEFGAQRAAHVAELLRLRGEREQDETRLADAQRALADERAHFAGQRAALDAEVRARDEALEAVRVELAHWVAEHEVLAEALARQQSGTADLEARARELSVQHEQVAWELVTTRRRVAELEVAVAAAREAESSQAAARAELATEVSSLRDRLVERAARVGVLEADLAAASQAHAADAEQSATRIIAAQAAEADLQLQLTAATYALEQAQYRVLAERAAEELAVSRCAALDEELVAARVAIATAAARADAVDGELTRRTAELAEARLQTGQAAQVSSSLRDELADAGQQLEVLQASLVDALAAGEAAGQQHASDIDALRQQLAARTEESERRITDWQQSAERVVVLEQRLAQLEEQGAQEAALRAALEERGRGLECERAQAVDALAQRIAELASAHAQTEQAAQVSSALRDELADAGRQLASLQMSLDDAVSAAEQAGQQHASDIDSLRQQLAARAEESQRRTADWEQSAERVAMLEQRLAELQEEGAHGAALRAALERQVGEIEHERAQAVDAIVCARTDYEQAQLRLGQARDEAVQHAAGLAADLDAVRADLESRAEVARAAEAAAAERAQVAQRQNQLLQSQLGELEGDRERLRQLTDEVSSRLGAQGAALVAAENARTGLAEQLRAAGAAREEQAAELVNAHAQLVLARAQLDTRTVALREAEALCGGLQGRIGETEIALNGSRASEGQLREVVTERETRLVAAERQVETLRAEFEGAREAEGHRAAVHDAAAAALTSERDELLKWLEEEQRAQTDLRAQLLVAQAELERVRHEASDHTELHDAAAARAAALAARVSDLESVLGAQQDVEVTLRESVCTAEAELGALREQVATTEGLRHELGQRLAALHAELEQGAAQAARVQVAAEESQIQREQARAAQAVLSEECDQLRGVVAQRQRELDALQAEVAELRAVTVVGEEMAQRAEALQVQIADRDELARAADQRAAALQIAVDELQGQLFKEQSHAAALWSDLERESQFREALDSALAEARARTSELEVGLQREQKRRTAHEVAQRESTDEAAELLVRVELLESRLAESDAERERLQEQVNSLWALKDGLDRECEQLRRKVASSDDWERQRGDATRSQARVDELERLQREAMQRHSAAVSGYMLELNQRSDALRQRDAELLKAGEELSVLQAACDDAVGQLTTVRQERELLELRVRELEAGRPRPRLERPLEAASVPKAEGAVAKPAAPLALREESRRPSAAATELAAPKPDESPRLLARFGEPVVLVHIEDDPGLQEAVRAATAKFEHARYTPLASAGDEHGTGRRLFALNLLARDVDPLAAMGEAAVQGREDPSAFTYLASGSRGFVIGPVDFFPHPFEADACASRLLGRPGGLQRLLVVSEDVDTMGGLREVLGRVRCSTAIAFDGRQALDLVPMIKPEVVLVDLSLPRGEALRIVSRLRSDPKTTAVGVAMLWTSPLNSKEVAQSAQRALGEYALSHQDLGRALTRVLAESDMGLLSAEAIREAG